MTHRSDHRQSGNDVPLVGRPRGDAWRDLQSDGVVWEGQVFITGDGADLATRLIVTTTRVAFARGGDVILDAPRTWLRPAPELLRDGTVAFHIIQPDSGYDAPPETLRLTMRDSDSAGSHLVAMLSGSAGRRSLADLDALSPIARPVYQEHRAETVSRAPEPFDAPRWPEPDPVPTDHAPAWTTERQVALNPAAAAIAAEEANPVFRPSSPPSALGPSRDWNLPVREYVVPRNQRRPRWGWTARISGLIGLLSIAAALGAGRIPSPLDSMDLGQGNVTPLPTSVSDISGGMSTEVAPIVVEPIASEVPEGIGGASGPVFTAMKPGNAPVAAPPLQVTKGTTETWTEPTAAPPKPALLAAPAVSTMPAAAVVTDPAEDVPSAEQIATEVAEAMPTPTSVPTLQPIVNLEPTAAPEPTSVPEPTAAPEPTATDVPAPVVEIVEEPTSTPEPQLTATAVPEPTATTAPAATATFPPEPTATAEPEQPVIETAQSVATEEQAAPAAPALSYAVQMATGGQTLPGFGLPRSPAGNWVVVVVDVANRGDAPASIPLSSFRLGTSAGDASLDPSTDLAAMISGVTPQWSASDVIELEPGDATRALLLFQVDPSASDMTLLGTGLEQPLADILASGSSIAGLPAEATAP